ncbi:o-succinylbenzoate synthase [Hymenobacter rubripertinctus]|uniref:O-succinylbenzoate synthase n=1 Tax=Hymenobacter rubripertinctus TaxID=2029981 RepID=A0A418QZ48_9BACT|nr:o-succinylbenzoate synthase [Hymenobacter rubripertinctus]RIY10443.1 o-succinylbenzoate synthase [Hymenobacter rubripertinctus]
MLQLRHSRRILRFNFPARTSRGALTEHTAHYLHLYDEAAPGQAGWGEAAPLAGLSPDHRPDFEATLDGFVREFNRRQLRELLPEEAAAFVGPEWPALRFALETAALDLQRGSHHQLYDNAFSRGEAGLPINGLVWMGEAAFMREQIEHKLAAGYNCLKLKIGGLDFAAELRILADIRALAGPGQLTLRVDANGAFSPAEALGKLEQLARYDLHSIEQPIAAGQWPELARVCRHSPVPVALDEELIGLTDPARQRELLERTHPAYLILKPTLLGGLRASHDWLTQAESQGIGWWLTSALESNVGLSAISQLAGTYAQPGLPQGLGTGQLYHNNLAAPLSIRNGRLYHEPAGLWEEPG